MASDSITTTADWSNLPDIALSIIAKKLDTGKLGLKIGHLRLRSVCSTWRLSLLPPPKPTLQFPLKVPPAETDFIYSLEQRFVLRISPPGNPKSQGWLVKLKQKENDDKTFLLSEPLKPERLHGLKRYCDNHRHSYPLDFNLLDYRVSHIAESYFFRVSTPKGRDTLDIRKVAVAYDFVEDGDFVVMAVTIHGELGFWKSGEVEWTFIVRRKHDYKDVVFYDGKFYVIDSKGAIVMIDSTFEPVEIASEFDFYRTEFTNMLLVDCGGELLVVHECGPFHGSADHNHYLKVSAPNYSGDNKHGVGKNHLNGRSLFLGYDVNFSIMADDFFECKEDCVYRYTKDFNHFLEWKDIYSPLDGSCVHDLKNNEVDDLKYAIEYLVPYWPPPKWLLPC